MMIRGACFLLLLVVTLPAYSQMIMVSGLIEKTMITDSDKFGGCMVKLDEPLSDSGLDCPSSWVSFSCSGDFNEIPRAYRMLDAAQVAQMVQAPVFMVVDDTRMHNGYCYGMRITLDNPP